MQPWKIAILPTRSCTRFATRWRTPSSTSCAETGSALPVIGRPVAGSVADRMQMHLGGPKTEQREIESLGASMKFSDRSRPCIRQCRSAARSSSVHGSVVRESAGLRRHHSWRHRVRRLRRNRGQDDVVFAAIESKHWRSEPRAGSKRFDAGGLAVAPGFINMLSWATESLMHDPRSQSDIRQGVTLEVMGEGESMGPLNPAMKKLNAELQGDIKYDISWTTLGEYLGFIEKKGISTNVASFVGATTVRIHELGYADRAPTPEELGRMRTLVRQAMEEGALGVGSSLIYAPAFYARTEELIALSQEAAKYGGMYISHIRSEGNGLLEAVDELIR